MAKENPAAKMEKTENVLRSKTKNRHSAFTIEAIVNDFVSWLVLVKIKGNLVFNFMYDRFWFDGDFFVRNLDASTELRQYQSLS